MSFFFCNCVRTPQKHEASLSSFYQNNCSHTKQPHRSRSSNNVWHGHAFFRRRRARGGNFVDLGRLRRLAHRPPPTCSSAGLDPTPCLPGGAPAGAGAVSRPCVPRSGWGRPARIISEFTVIPGRHHPIWIGLQVTVCFSGGL